jgi:hypothetical protein
MKSFTDFVGKKYNIKQIMTENVRYLKFTTNRPIIIIKIAIKPFVILEAIFAMT